jgi:SAM-dependent methyltransferase
MSTPAEYRQASHDRWSRAASGWGAQAERLQSWAMPVSHWMVEAIAPQPGQTVLELAAGPGDTGLLAGELVRPGGTLVSSDFAEPMLDVARERAAALGLDNVTFRVIDAESIDLPAASVDAVLCRWGYMLMADPAAALSETRRVLRPGGRLALSAWDAAEHNAWARVPSGELVSRGLASPPRPEDPSMFAFAVPGRIETLLGDAGFVDVVLDHVDLEVGYEDIDAFLAVTIDCSRPFADALEALDDAARADLRASIATGLAEFRQSDGSYRVPARCLVAAASA